MHKSRKVILIIMDGWGMGKPDKFNAIDNAHKPNIDKLIREFPNTRLFSHGHYVGLPDDQFGTSEINHQVIGSGRVVMQDLPRINNAIASGDFFTNEALVKLCRNAHDKKSALHIVGIISDGKVHADIGHIKAMLKLAKNEGVEKVFIHAFADGRDTPPQSAMKYMDQLTNIIRDYPEIDIKIASMQGRFYLDRDRDWSKTEKAIKLMIDGEGYKVSNYEAAINLSYNEHTIDEFFPQYIFCPEGTIKVNDSVMFMHYRSDRLYQIVKSLLDRNIKNLVVGTFIEISENIKTEIAFKRPVIDNTLAEVISLADRNQYHVTETEKYTHLTYFFNCQREKPFEGEEWKLFESDKFVKPFYNYLPTMRNYDITRDVLQQIDDDKQDLILINFCSPDMVGHTGDYYAAVISTQSVDYCIGKIYEAIRNRLDEYILLITADHGNSDIMWDYTNNQPHTQHTHNPVPFIFVSNLKVKLERKEGLQDIAPTVLDAMNLEIPSSMTGKTLIIKE